MNQTLTFWARPSAGTGWAGRPRPTRPQVIRAVATLGAVLVGTGGGAFHIFSHIATHDIDWSQRSNVTLATLGGILALTAIGLTYTLANHLWLRSRRTTPRKAALTLDTRGFKHWAARPTRQIGRAHV